MTDPGASTDFTEYTFAQARELAGVEQEQIREWAYEGRFAVIHRETHADILIGIPVAIHRHTFDEWLHQRAETLASGLHVDVLPLAESKQLVRQGPAVVSRTDTRYS